MAGTKRTTRTIIEESPNENDEPVVSEDPGDDPETDSTLKDFIEKLGPGTITFKVFRATTKGLEFAFSGEDEFDEETLQGMYPTGGKFTIRVYRNGKYVPPSHSIRIAPKPYAQNMNGNMNGNQNNGAYELQMTLMRDQMQRQHEMLMAMITKGGNQQPQTSMKDMVETLVAMRSLQPDTNLDVLMKGIELAREVNGDGGDWKSEVIKMAKDVGPALLMARTPPPTPPAPPNPAPNPPVNTNTNPAPSPSPQLTQGDGMQTQIRMGIALLKKKCDQGIAPEFFVDQAVVMSDQEVYQRLISTIVENDFDTFANMVDPSIAQPPYREWFLKVYEGIKQDFTENSDDDANDDVNTDETNVDMANDSTGTAGDGRNAEGDGASIPAGDRAS